MSRNKTVIRSTLKFCVFLLLHLTVGELLAQSDECGTKLSRQQSDYMKQIRQAVHSNGSGPSGGGNFLDIPVIHHIVRNSDGSGGLSETDLEAIMDTLNNNFAGASLRFVQCGQTNYIDDDEFFSFQTDEESDLCAARDQGGALNIYYVDEISYGPIYMCGYTYFPGGANRMFLDIECAVNGKTILHEMGHFLSLLHTHGHASGILTDELVDGSNCLTAGDFICDTPPDPGLDYFNVSSACAYDGTAVDANGQLFHPVTDNHMSYARRDCRTSFTPAQKAAMYFSAMFDRPDLQCSCTPPTSLEASSSSGGVSLNWDEIQGATMYEIAGRKLGGTRFVTLQTSNPSRHISGLKEGAHFEWKVRAQCADGAITTYSELDTFSTQSERQFGVQEKSRAIRIIPEAGGQQATIFYFSYANAPLKAEFFNMSGASVFQASMNLRPGQNVFSFPMENLESGLYIVRLKEPNHEFSRKMLVP